ncbi:MAG: sulfite exporter TauE/SafE family protein [Chloroflexi bacterium]|uniref:Sulfite exporter TauE/SafE family protein n=1 Tax=Candidatus Chlorohelix allophototropha TaxID=3003348 RepID=A0A8T7MAC7_9CHLR|nr:sulfite exporter TauE/SafE family protein [Chloroflexota bacterium]WJW68942.1 sulfite exporter TauE/SafE family protein [Chloroflexota bacterium L227-S17]
MATKFKTKVTTIVEPPSLQTKASELPAKVITKTPLQLSNNKASIIVMVLLGIGCLAILALPWILKVDSITSFSDAGSLLLVFLTGLTMGGLSCLAVQSGLLATSIAQREQNRQKLGKNDGGHAVNILVFLGGKLTAYTLLGGILGWVGSLITMTNTLQGIINLLAGLFMLATALNLLEVHPIFRYVMIQPPRSVMRYLRRYSKSDDFYATAILGTLTVLIPCGTTVAMEALAISSGNAINGALIMGAFILGTTPVFFTLGYFASKLGAALQSKFMKIAAVAIILLSLFSVNSALNLLESPISINSITASIFPSNKSVNVVAAAADLQEGDYQLVVIKVEDEAYVPNREQVSSGKPIRLRLVTNNTTGCTRSFTIGSFGIRKVLPITGQVDIDLPAQSPGVIRYICSMGMYSGKLTVV